MRSYTLALTLAASLLTSCSIGSDRDYQLVVSWVLNGFVPDADLCQELGIATARLEVRSGDGTRVRTLEADCDELVKNSEGETFGGFITSPAFAWEVRYTYVLTLLDANGNVRSTPPAEGEFFVGYDEADFFEIGYLDYVAPAGQAAALHAEWSVRTGDVAAACAAERIAKVRIVAVSALNEEFEAPVVVAEAPCAEGRFTTNGQKVLARGDFRFRYEAVSEAGSLVQAGDPIPVLVDGTQDIVLPRELFLN